MAYMYCSYGCTENFHGPWIFKKKILMLFIFQAGELWLQMRLHKPGELIQCVKCSLLQMANRRLSADI